MDLVGLTVYNATIILLLIILIRVFRAVLWRPYAVTKYFRQQGVSGPPYSLLTGSLPLIKPLMKEVSELILDTNSNDIFYRVLPHYHRWSSQYGDMFLYWHGIEPHLCVSDPEMVKQILSNKFGFYEKPSPKPYLEALVGRGLGLVNGLDWVKQRRIINPAFTIDKLKVMVKRVAECGEKLIEEFKRQANVGEERAVEVDMCQEFQKLTADIIAHLAFGSSYVEGKEAFKAQKDLQSLCVAAGFNPFIPGIEYLPTPSNLRLWRLDKKVKSSLRHIIKSRMNKYGDDLLGLMIQSSKAHKVKEGLQLKLSMKEIIDNCKTFFFAGYETTANLLTWTMFLLSVHPDWQVKLREEVAKECGSGIPDADKLSKLKLVNMVVMEALRLYCPAIMLERKTSKEMKLGNVRIAKGTNLMIPITKIHTSKKYWGEDAIEFNPMRFEKGMAKAANHPNALLSFSMGPRVCIGQHFTMLEAKTLLALLLRAFSFSLSPEYKHAPTNFMTLEPQFGMPLILKPLT